ncbi:Alpha/beta hydrolase family protein [Parapedobacter luteus]|uniref:Alpha/beta hydrolase family protein n=2 Tax=Parapedobacter luteus TaxID=623280 RepID=A0A1T5DTK0_9SPHI|nr:Alpha/beta hydrolase family protein [Parapedobacter luteus]
MLSNACVSNHKYTAIKDNLYVVPAERDNTDELALESLLVGSEKGKPLIIFLTGSGSYPLAVRAAADSNYYFLFHHDIVSDSVSYNYLFVSKPHIPAVVEQNDLDPETRYFNFSGSNELFAKFSKKNTIEYFVDNLPKLIKQAKKQLKPSEIILMGHSQGARIVAEMVQTPVIDKFVYMSASPLGRMFYAGIDSAAYNNILYRNDSPDRLEVEFEMGDSYKTWKSYSYSPMISIASTRKPLLIVYGDKDKSCVQCDMFHTLKWKNKNITIKKYNGLNHNFFNENNQSNWKEVIADVDKWIKSN